MDSKSFDPNDPERNRKRIENVGVVLNRIQKNLVTKTREIVKEETKEEQIEKLLKAAREDRAGRNLLVGFNERFVIELISLGLGVDENVILDCVVDSGENIKLLRSIFERDGALMLLIQFQPHAAPSMKSGRYNHALRLQKVDTALFSEGYSEKIVGSSVFVYRLDNAKAIESTTVSDDIFFNILPEGDTVISSIHKTLSKTVRQALEASSEYGKCSESRKKDFLYGVDNFIQFLESTTSDIVSCTINFHVNHQLFKGFLLASHQIEATSKRRDKVAEVEHDFNQWMKQIKVVVSQGQQLVHIPNHAGPLTELEHWRKMLSKFNNVLEFTDSRPFQSFLRCLKLSRSKLIRDWKAVEDDLVVLLNEARDNVRFMSSIEKYWDPLYRSPPLEIADNLPTLLEAIRSVYNNSRYYNSGLRISGFLTKIVNQIIIASRNYLTNKRQISVWDQNMKSLVKKIDECKKLKESFRFNYQKILQDMEESGETPFDCSENYFFGSLELFEVRLAKIREIMEVCVRYQVLDRISISGMEVFSERIKSALKEIAEKAYDPLAHRHAEFDEDYFSFMKDVTSVEAEMGVFVKLYVDKIENVEMRLVTLKRFARLNLESLRLDRRYLDIVTMLEKEIEDIKDKYNEERAAPFLERNVPPVVARIMWARSLLKKMEEPLNDLKGHHCVIEHSKAQISVQCFNSLATILSHYEAMHHQAWFTYASTVRNKLEAPLVRKNVETNQYEVNLDKFVLQVLKETDAMQKLELEIPETLQHLCFCQNKIFDVYNRTTALIERNNSLRRSIYPMFVPMMRIQLIKLERIFSPALSTVTWLTQNLEEHFSQISEVLDTIEGFLKEVSDMNDAQIEVALKSIEDMNLILLPDDAVWPQDLLEINVNHRKEVEKKIEMKSLTAEKVAVELINKFVMKSGVPDYDDSGKFQLPLDEINDENKRTEEWKPINKFDWVSFGKLYKAVGYASPEENEELCFKDYDGLKYDVTLLHIDCVELFAYFNHKVIAALAKCTKRSMEILKKRSNISGQIPSLICGSYEENSLIVTSVDLKIPNFELAPNMKTIQELYDATLHNIVETHYAVSTWGKQAKIKERAGRKPLIDEIRHEKSWFKAISEHKEVWRYKLSFDNGILQLEGRVNLFLNDLFHEYNFLWSENRENDIEEFVQKKPLLANIRDKFVLYDQITKDIFKLDKLICMRTIEINCEKMIEALVEESKAWKLILGNKLIAFYRVILLENIKIIKNHQRILSKEIKVIDDCRIAFLCLKSVRENIFSLDENLNLLERAYALFNQFHINIPTEDMEKVDSLRGLFETLCESVEFVSGRLRSLQKPLQDELEANVAKFKEDVAQYDEDFVEKGPMAEGIPAKEANDRIILFEAKLHDLVRLNELYAEGEKLYELPVNEYPVLAKRMQDINLLTQLYRLYLDFMGSFNYYSKSLFKEINGEAMNEDIQEISERFKQLPKGMERWPAFIDLKQKIQDFSDVSPVIVKMTSAALDERHWRMLEDLMHERFDTLSSNFTLSVLMQAPLLSFKEGIEEICLHAINEQNALLEKTEAKNQSN